MNRGSFAKVGLVAVALGVAVGGAMAGTATAGAATEMAKSPATVCGASACEVVLSCGGAVQKTVPNAEGGFTFHDVPAGTCTVSVAEATTQAMSGSTAMSSSSAAAPRDAATGMATGKRQHKPMAWQVTMDELVAVRSTSADAASSAVSVVLPERRKELTGHVTLIK